MREQPREERAPVRGGLILILVVCATAGACSRAAPRHGPADQARALLAAYLPPPAVTAAERQGAAVRLGGSASPGAAIRLASPEGSAITGTADRKGAWRLNAPAGAAPRLYSLSEVLGGRLVRAVGYVAVLPAPGPPAAMLRPAATASLPASPGSARGLSSIDYDASGQAMVAGRAWPGETVRLSVDGHEAGEDRADAAGGFSASLSRTLPAGPHVLSLAGQRLRASAAFAAARTSQLASPPYDARHTDGGWRIDWLTPGGGVQSTLLFDSRGGRS